MTEPERTQRAFARLRLFTILITLALVLFTVWISDGVRLGRIIAAGVLALGFLQWFALGRVAKQIAANASEGRPMESPPT